MSPCLAPCGIVDISLNATIVRSSTKSRSRKTSTLTVKSLPLCRRHFTFSEREITYSKYCDRQRAFFARLSDHQGLTKAIVAHHLRLPSIELY
ncbi:hypothetical protein N7470_008140 [Penicillium chermesinum]|nr:hypothetical protein N7470_008140 [Penicillium chermesinum]